MEKDILKSAGFNAFSKCAYPILLQHMRICKFNKKFSQWLILNFWAQKQAAKTAACCKILQNMT